jgi:hypothetical protein
VPQSIAGTEEFLLAYQHAPICAGGIISNASNLERFRFCEVVNGSLLIDFDDEEADYSSLFDIRTIEGLPYPSSIAHSCVAGSLVVSGSAMKSLSVFKHLIRVGGGAAPMQQDGSAYDIIITGWSAFFVNVLNFELR